jgi:N-acetylmuramoyl-L-alanine amidase
LFIVMARRYPALPLYTGLVTAIIVACSSRALPDVAPGPTRFPVAAPVLVVADTPAPGLPGIRPVTNAPIALSVVYPARDQLIQAADSNFLLGSAGTGDVALTINGVSVPVKPNGAYLAWLPVPSGTSPVYRLVARRGTDSAMLDVPVQTRASVAARPPQPPAPPPVPPPLPRLVSLGQAPALPDSDVTINLRPVAGGTYKWFAIPGTIVEQTAVDGGYARIRMDGALDAFVANADIVPLGDSASLPRRVIPNLSVIPDSAWTDVVFPLRDPPLFLVEEEHDKLIVTFYGTRGTTDIISFRRGDDLVRTVTWEPVTTDRVRYVVHLRQAPFGYLAFHDGRAFTLRVRRAPAVNRERPLAGMTIAVDAGHPPAGSTGPTGLYEGDLTLPIAVALQEELEQRGARVVMTRTTLAAFALGDRPIIARRGGAHALISIHLNAVPDGVNPLEVHGTGTYFFHPHSEPLARAVQDGMVRSMGLRDLGVFYDNLALVRPTWMPAILCEGAFLIVPEHEAAMATPEGQRAYARGVAAGVEAYFRALDR